MLHCKGQPVTLSQFITDISLHQVQQIDHIVQISRFFHIASLDQSLVALQATCWEQSRQDWMHLNHAEIKFYEKIACQLSCRVEFWCTTFFNTHCKLVILTTNQSTNAKRKELCWIWVYSSGQAKPRKTDCTTSRECQNIPRATHVDSLKAR